MRRVGGGIKDDAIAAKWYLKAAQQGSALAKNSLGLMYAEGRGVLKNEMESQQWYSKACAQGHKVSCQLSKTNKE